MNRQQKTLHVHISNLATSVNVTSSVTGIVTVSPTTITLTAAEATAGKKIILTRNGGYNGAKLSISGINITQSHTMSGN